VRGVLFGSGRKRLFRRLFPHVLPVEMHMS
jgi:hypothetical protein